MCDMRIIQKIRLKDGSIVETKHRGKDLTMFSDWDEKTGAYSGYNPPKDNKPGFYRSIPYVVTGYTGDVYFDGKNFLKERVDYDVYEWKNVHFGMPVEWNKETKHWVEHPELINKIYTLEDLGEINV